MLRAHEFRNVVYVTQQRFSRQIALLANIRPKADDADHATRGRTGLDLFVGHVAAISRVPDRQGVGMADDDRTFGRLEHIHCRAMPGVCHIDKHAGTVHFGDQAAAISA